MDSKTIRQREHKYFEDVRKAFSKRFKGDTGVHTVIIVVSDNGVNVTQSAGSHILQFVACEEAFASSVKDVLHGYILQAAPDVNQKEMLDICHDIATWYCLFKEMPMAYQKCSVA